MIVGGTPIILFTIFKLDLGNYQKWETKEFEGKVFIGNSITNKSVH